MDEIHISRLDSCILASHAQSAVRGTSNCAVASIAQSAVMIRFCPRFIFLFPLPFSQSHDLMSPDPCHLTGRSPDLLVTWPSLIVLTSHCLEAHCPPYMGTPIVSGLIVLLPIVLPCYCLRLHCTPSPIVRLIRTLSHGSCLSSI